MTLLAVAAGGALGSVLRFVLAGWVAARLGAAAYGILAVNVLGSFLMGVAFVILMERLSDVRLAPLVLTGCLGGFTTFSAFSLDAIRLWEAGQTGAMLAYVSASVLLSIIGLGLGMMLTRAVV